MKKMSLLLVLLLLLASTSLATEPLAVPPDETAPLGIYLEEPAQVRKDFKGTRSATPFPKPNDEVSIKDGVFSITSKGIKVEFQVPFVWIGLTQDISLQLVDYAAMTEPLNLLNTLISNNISLLAVEPDTNANLLAYFDSDNMSALINDLNTEDMVDIVLKTFSGEAVTVGDRHYISVLEDASLIYFTYYNGVRVSFQLYLEGSEPTTEETETMTDFVEMTNYL